MLCVHGERIGAAARTVERHHVQPGSTIAERIERAQRRRLGERLTGVAVREQRRDVRLRDGQSHLGRRNGIGADPLLVGHVCQQGSTPQPACLFAELQCIMPTGGVDLVANPAC